MATPITNQKSSSIKYKFGDDELDLNDYIRNLNHNYQSYVNSQNWNEGQRQEFRAAYENFLGGLRDQLANNTNRFSTDFSGSLIDSTGQLSNTDNDDIDPVGSEYYYDNNGNSITTDDFNTMKKRQQKKYNTFSANRQVATFFNKVGTALRDARRNKPTVQEKPNRFDLSRHGFLANWTTMNNPAGGELNLDPYLEKDSLDETTGQRGTTNRANYLKEQIENYINNIEDLDFSGSPFKDRDTYISRLRAAADNLGNGYNSEDVIALNQAGIGNEFLGKFFATGAEQKKTEAQQAAEDLMRIQQQQQEQEIINQRNQALYEADRDKFFSQYEASNPFQSKEPSIPLPLSYNRSEVEAEAFKRFNADPNNKEAVREAIRQRINIPQLSSLIRGRRKLMMPDGTDITAQHITNNLDLAAQADLFVDPKYLNDQGKSILPNGYYVLPGSEDYDSWTYIAYNPDTRQYQEQSMLLNKELKKRMAYSEYDKRNKKSNEAQKHQLGGTFKDLENRQNKAQVEKQKIQQESYATGRTKEQIESDQAPHTEWSKADLLRLGAIGGDVASLIASMTGVGSVASAGIGVASTAANQAADMAEGMGFLESLGNNAVSYGLDALSLIPFARAAKIPKTIKAIAGFAPKLMAIISTAQGIANAPEITKSLSKLNSSESLTVEDWRNIANGIQIVLGGTAATHRASKAKSHVDAARTNDEWLKTEQGYRRISEQDMKKLREASSIKEQNAILNPYDVTLAESRKKFGLGKGKGKADITSEHYYYDFDKPVTTYSGDLPIQHTFGPVERWLGTRKFSLNIPGVRDTYNKVFHPQAYNRVNRTSNTKQENTTDFSRLRELSSRTSKLTPQEISTINRQRTKSGKGKLTAQEIEQLNQRRARRAETPDERMTSAYWRATPYRYGQWEKLREYKKAKREGRFNSVEDDIKRAQDELAEAVRQQRLAVPTGQGQIISPDAKQVRTIVGLSKAIPTVSPSRPTTQSSTNLPAVIPKQQIRLERSPQLNMQRVREGVARAERERLGRDIGNTRIQRAIETNPERTARLQAQDAYRNVRNAINTYSIPQYKRPLSGAAYNAKQNMYNQLFNQSNRKKKTSRDDRVTRKEGGGTIDLVKVRKFQNAGKFPDWYSGLYKFPKLKNWSDQLDYSKAGPSIVNENAGHFRAGDLGEAFNKNSAYISNPNLISSDLQSYYTSSFNGKPLDDFISQYNSNAAKIRGYWDQERAYRESGASGHNQLFRNMFKNRSNDSNNAWNIGYDPNLEDTVGSSTWLRRMDRYEKEFDSLEGEERKGRIHKIDLGDGNFGYVYKKANGDIARWDNLVEQPQVSQNKSAATNPIVDQPVSTNIKKWIGSFLSSLSPTITHGLPRALYADRMNRKITDLAKESITPLLKDPFEVHRYTRSDLDAEMQGERNYANLRRLASRPITSDGSLQTAMQLQAEVQGQEARTLGKEKSNQVQRQYDEAAQQQEKENAANRHETAMFNRAQQWGAEQDKSKFEQAYLSKKFNIWDVVGQQLEYDERVKQQERKGTSDNFARSDIHDAVMYTPNEYGAQLTPEELAVWNKVITGTNPSTLGSELNIYTQAMKKVQRAETQQLRKYYKVPDTQWQIDTKFPKTDPVSILPQSMKKGGKVEVAGIEAKTADAERFQKQIKETIDRNEKAIERLSKSLYGIIKASMIK